jgi:hypothetical protein
MIMIRSFPSIIAAIAITAITRNNDADVVVVVNAQEMCDMCSSSAPAGTPPVNADLVIPFLAIAQNDNPTCAEARAFGLENVTLSDAMCKVITDHANFCGCPGMPGTPTNFCSLCPDKSAPGLTNAATPYNDTCSELDNYLRFLPEEECFTERVQAVQRADAFCQCPGVVADCYMCPDGTNAMTNPNNLVPFYEFLSDSFSTPCQDLADFYTLYDTDDPEISTCEFIKKEALYCGCVSSEPIFAPKAIGLCARTVRSRRSHSNTLMTLG